MDAPALVLVAGHICLDLVPAFPAAPRAGELLFQPGKLVHVGPALTTLGGAVANTGLALHRLGVPVRLVGRVGADLFGAEVLNLLRRSGEELAREMIVAPGETTSYSLVINPPGMDRFFLHCPGANDAFTADDLAAQALEDVRLFHFGYPPIMRRMYRDGGAELEALMRRVASAGIITSLDMAYPDPESEAGRVNWEALLERVLPAVDLFLPSLDEILFMLDRPAFASLQENASNGVEGARLRALADRLLAMGAASVGIKLGEQGLYLRTSAAPDRMSRLLEHRALPETWLGRELYAPCFRVDVAGTTGAGDATIAGLIAGLLQGLSPEAALLGAVAAGAYSVEGPDPTSRIPTWAQLQARIASGWAQREVNLSFPYWRWTGRPALGTGPMDATRLGGA